MSNCGDHEATRWSRLAQLHEGDAAAGWDWFIRRYRGYVVAVLRRFGIRATELDAATEDFWSYLFESRAIARAHRDGRFRSFLSGVVRNYARRWRRLAGEGQDEVVDAALVPAGEPQELHLWAGQMLQLGLVRLRAENCDHEQALRWFYGLAGEVGGVDAERLSGTEIAHRLGRTPNAMHQLLFRARRGLRECIVKEVAMTVESSPELRDEASILLGAIASVRPGLVDARESTA